MTSDVRAACSPSPNPEILDKCHPSHICALRFTCTPMPHLRLQVQVRKWIRNLASLKRAPPTARILKQARTQPSNCVPDMMENTSSRSSPDQDHLGEVLESSLAFSHPASRNHLLQELTTSINYTAPLSSLLPCVTSDTENAAVSLLCMSAS